MRKTITLLLFSLLLTLFYNCSDNDEIINTPPSTEINISTLSHPTAKIGEKIVAHITNSSNYRLVYVDLNDEPVLFKQESDSTVSLFIPYLATSGQFILYFYSPQNEVVKIKSPTITITKECFANLCVEWNSKIELVESDSWIKDFMSDSLKWSIEISSDTIFITRHGICHDECGFYNTLVFKSTFDDQLPQYLFSVYEKYEWLHPAIQDTLRNGVIVVNNWNSNTNYSGTFSFDNHNWVFWINNN